MPSHVEDKVEMEKVALRVKRILRALHRQLDKESKVSDIDYLAIVTSMDEFRCVFFSRLTQWGVDLPVTRHDIVHYDPVRDRQRRLARAVVANGKSKRKPPPPITTNPFARDFGQGW